MHKRSAIIAGVSALAAAVPLLGLAPAASATTGPRPSPVVGHAYVNDNTAGHEHLGRLRPTRRRHAHPDGRVAVRHRRRRARQGPWLPGRSLQATARLPARRRRRQQPDLGAPPQRGGRALPGRRAGLLRRRQPVSIAVSPYGLVYVANVGNGGSNYTGFWLAPFGTLHAAPWLHRCRARRLCRRRRLLQLHRRPLVGTPRHHVADRQLHRRLRRPAGRGPGSPFAAQSLGPIGSEFRPTHPSPAVRQQRARRRRPRHGVGVPRQPQRRAHVDRLLAVPRRPDRPVLDRDQPRRPVPVRRQHRVGEHLELPDQRTTARWYCWAPPRSHNGAGAVDARLSPDGRTLSVTGGSGHVLSSRSRSTAAH